jgi:hypothetical protein
MQRIRDERWHSRRTGNPTAADGAHEIAAAAHRLGSLRRLMARIEQHALATSQHLRKCQRPLAPGPARRRNDPAIDDRDDAGGGADPRTRCCGQLRHGRLVVFCALRQVEKLLDQHRPGGGYG